MMHSVEKMIKIFMEADDNNDGVVTRAELEANYKKLGISKKESDVSYTTCHRTPPPPPPSSASQSRNIRSRLHLDDAKVKYSMIVATESVIYFLN